MTRTERKAKQIYERLTAIETGLEYRVVVVYNGNVGQQILLQVEGFENIEIGIY